MAIAQNFPNIRPSLNLSFALTKALDPRITFARASAATYYGTETAKAEENLFLRSQEFDNAGWAKVSVGVTANSEVSPDGTTTGDTATVLASTGSKSLQQTILFVNGQPYTLSVFAKKGTLNFIQLRVGNGVGGAFANFNLDTGVVGTLGKASGNDPTSSITNLGGGWYRCTISVTVNATSSSTTGVFFVSSASAGSAENWTADGTETVFLWGAQIEQRDSVTNYTPTTTQPITNFVPVLESAAAGEARFDHNPVTGESLGLLIEESRTNLLLRSEEFDDAGWSKNNASITANTIVAPDGTLTGDKLVENTTASVQHRVSTSSITVSSSAAFSFTFYAKAAERTFVHARIITTNTNVTGVFDLVSGASSGTGSSITNVGNGWYRCAITGTTDGTLATGFINLATSFSTSIPSYTGDGFSGIFVWGASLEQGAFPTSYVKTTTAQVTRAADAASMTGANFSSWYSGGAGTVYSESAVYAVNIKTQCVWELGGGVTSTSLRSPQGTVNRLRATVGGIFSGASTGASISNNTLIKATVAWQGLSGRLQSGATGEDVTGAANLDATQLIVGGLSVAGSTALNGHIKKLAFYPAKIPNDQLIGLTTV